MKKQLILFLGTFLLSSGFVLKSSAAQTLDSVIVELDDHTAMFLITNTSQDLTSFSGVDSLLQILTDQVLNGSQKTTASSITFQVRGEQSKILVQESPGQGWIINAAPEQTETTRFPDEIILDFGQQRFIIFPQVFDLNALNAQSIDPIIARVNQALLQEHLQKRIAFRGTYMFQEDSARTLLNDSYGNDAIELYGGTGASLVRDRFLPEMGIGLSVLMSDKNRVPRHRYSVKYTWQYLFNRKAENGYRMDLNGFLMGEYAYNYSSNPDGTRWFVVGLGYLVSEKGDFWEGNTARGYIRYALSNRIYISSDIYATNDFGTFFPGVGVGIGI